MPLLEVVSIAQARISILGDASSYKRAVREASAVSAVLEKDMAKLAISAKSSAEAQVAASIHKTSRLRNELTAYREIAAAAKHGSSEQIAAANLATRAEGRLAGSLGVAAREARMLSRSSSNVERDLGRATRGALAGSGVFRGLGRSIAFASGGFLAFASGGQFIRKSIDAAKEAGVTQKQLSTQLRDSGLSFAKYRGEIDKTDLHLSALSGFTKDQLDSSFTTILRTTGNVTKALRDNATAADLARARHIGLAQAGLIIAKTEANNTTLLRRQGFQIAKNATVEQALAIVRAKVLGQARAGSTEQERFGAVLHDSEVIIGAGLLPTLNQYLASGAKWLTQMNESGRLQKDVAHITHDVTRALHDAGQVAKVLRGTFRDLNKVTGSTENTLKSFGEVWLLLKLRTSLVKWGLIESGIAGTGTAAEVATGKVAGLSGALGRLRTVGPIIIGVEIAVHRKQVADAIGNAVKDATGSSFFGSVAKGFERVAIDIANPSLAGTDIAKALSGSSKLPDVSGDSRITGGRGQHGALRGRIPRTTLPAALLGPRPLSLAGQFNLAELRLANAQLTATFADDRRILQTEAAIVRQQIAHTGKLKERIALTQQLAGILGQVRSIDQADAAAAKQATQAARDRAQVVLQAREFRVLGLDATGNPFTPKLGALRGELARVRETLKGTALDTRKNEGLLGNVTKLLFGKDAHSLTKDVRATVKQMLDGLRDELKHGVGPATKFQKADLSKLTAGFNLTAAEKRRLRARLSQVGAGGSISTSSPSTAGGGFGGSADIVIHNHTHVELDGREVGKSVTRHEQKRQRRNPPQRRGPHAD